MDRNKKLQHVDYHRYKHAVDLYSTQKIIITGYSTGLSRYYFKREKQPVDYPAVIL